MQLRWPSLYKIKKYKNESSCQGDLTMEIIEVVKKLEQSGFTRIQSEEQVKVMGDFVYEFKKDMAIHFGQINKKFEAIESRFDFVDKRFDAIDKKFDVIDKKLEKVDTRFDAIETQLQGFVTKEELKKDMRLLFYQVVFAVCGFIVIYADISPKLSGLLKLFAN